MVNRIRTAEDHNDQGLQVAPLPARYTRYDASDFVGGSMTHTLLAETPLAWVMLSSDEAELFLPTADGAGTWRLPPGMVWPVSTLDRRDVAMTLTGDGSFTVEIWEF